MRNIDSLSHVTGKSIYVDDLPELQNTNHAIILPSPVAHAKLLGLDTSLVNDHKDLVKIITAEHIPGENQIGGIIPDEELLVDNDIHFMGQALAIIVAKNINSAHEIRDKIKIEYEEKIAIVDPREAYQKGLTIGASRKLSLGNTEAAFDNCDVVTSGSIKIGGQEHLYLETQGAYAYPTELGYKVISSTQGPTLAQKAAARVLAIPMHMIEVDVQRLGGGFGGKEDQATPFACMALLVSHITSSPVKLILDRIDDMRMTGKRHPYEIDYKIGMKDNKLHAFEATFYQNAGACADLSPAILGRTLFHATNSYFIPNVKVTGHSCKTNLPPNTAFRGFGGPQGMFAIETAIHKLAGILKTQPEEIQYNNLLQDGDEFPYGQLAENVTIKKSWDILSKRVASKIDKIKQFNAKNRYHKMGYAFMPVSFGISFTNTSMNQAGSLVNVYLDGSVGVSTAAVEMGQGVNTRILQAVQNKFGIDSKQIKIESTNTTRVINTSPSAASATHDLNGKATQAACDKILARLLELASELCNNEIDEISLKDGFVHISGMKSVLSWFELVREANQRRIDLAAHGFYATPNIHFDREKGKGHPFAYHASGTAMVTASLDVIRGTCKIEEVDIVHDSGKSMNTLIDLGQIEGGVTQGLGWMLMEDLVYDDEGRLLSNALSTYKIPDIHFTPKINTEFLQGSENPMGLMGSKAVGEPPLMYGIAGYFAVRNAMKEFRDKNTEYQVPLTPERILLGMFS